MTKGFLIENVLIVQTSFLGDVILSSSVWEKIHEVHPNCKIDVLVRKGNEGLLANHPFINEVIVWDKRNKKYPNLFKVMQQARKKKYDLLINLQRYISTGIFSFLSGAKRTIGFKENPLGFLFSTSIKYAEGEQQFLHETARYHKLIDSFCGPVVGKMKLYPSKNDFERIGEFTTSPYLTLSPASVWETKELPVEKWIELCNQFSSDYKIYLCGGPDDKTLCEEILQKASNNKPIVLAGKLTLLESAALFASAKMNYCNDSAPTHIASAMNAAVTSFFLSTVPEFGFTPISDSATVVEVSEKLPCRPCGRHGKKKCPLEHFKCGKLIDIQKLDL